MASDEEVRLSFVADTAQIKSADAAVAKLNATFTDAGGRLRDVSGRFVKVGSDAWNAAKGIDSTTAALTANADAAARSSAVLTTSMRAGGVAAGNFSNKLQVVGQTLDDITYVPEQGLRPIINNLMQINPLLGTAAIVADTLWKNWTNLGRAFGATDTRTQAEEMKALGEQTSKTAAETQRLFLLQAAAKGAAAEKAAYASLAAMPTAEEHRGGEAFRQNIAEAGGAGRLAETIAAQRQGAGTYHDDAERAAIRKAEVAHNDAKTALDAGTFTDDAGRRKAPSHLVKAVAEAREAYDQAILKADTAAKERVESLVGRLALGKELDRLAVLELDSQKKFLTNNQRAALELSDPKMLRESEESKASAERQQRNAKAREEAAKPEARAEEQRFKAMVDRWQDGNSGKGATAAAAKAEDDATSAATKARRAAGAHQQAENRRDDKEILATNRPYMDGYTELLMKGRRMKMTDTQSDAAAERTMAFDLRRTGQVRDPLKANALAADAIADARRKFNAQNGEGGKETAENSKITEKLNATMERIERQGLKVTAVAG